MEAGAREEEAVTDFTRVSATDTRTRDMDTAWNPDPAPAPAPAPAPGPTRATPPSRLPGQKRKKKTRPPTETAFRVLASILSPRVVGSYAYVLRPLALATLAILTSVALGGKRRCFCILVAHLQNNSCAASKHPRGLCSISILNWVGDLSAALTFLAAPFVSNVLLSSKRAFGHQILQFVAVFAFGGLVTGFVYDPESLIVSDSIIQGISAGAILSLVTLRVAKVFPPSHQYHVLVTALMDGGPFGTVVFCPIFAVLIQHYHWQVVYSIMAALLLALCFASSVVSGTESSIIEPETLPPPPDLSDSSSDEEFFDNTESFVGMRAPTPHLESPGDAPPEPPPPGSGIPLPTPPSKPLPPDQVFTGAKMRELCRQPVVVLWCADRALFYMILYGVLMNIVDYMTVIVKDSLERGSLITLSFGGGEVVGLLIAVAFGDHLKEKLIYIYTVSTVIVFAVLTIWHLVQTHGAALFSGADVHFMAFVFGWATVFSNAYGYALSEELTDLPGQYAYPITRFAQGIGLLIAPLTSGVLLEVLSYSKFFLVQAMLAFIRLALQIVISFMFSRRRKEELEALREMNIHAH